MVSIDIGKQLGGPIFPFMLVFTRMGAMMLLFPGLAETYIPVQVRLIFTLAITLLVFMPLANYLPGMPATVGGLVALLAHEAIIGGLFGSFLRLLMSSIETAGSVISMQIGLSNATIFLPTLASQSPLPSAFLSVAAVALLFITGLDGMMLKAFLGTYDIFPVKEALIPGDMVQSYAQMATRSFAMGVELAAPFLIIGLLMYITMGVMQRLMPQVQLFMVMVPAQIWGGLILFAATLSAIGAVWLRYFDDTIGTMLVR